MKLPEARTQSLAARPPANKAWLGRQGPYPTFQQRLSAPPEPWTGSRQAALGLQRALERQHERPKENRWRQAHSRTSPNRISKSQACTEGSKAVPRFT